MANDTTQENATALDILNEEFGKLVDVLSGDAAARMLKAPLALLLRRTTEEGARAVLDEIGKLGARCAAKLAQLDGHEVVGLDAVEPGPPLLMHGLSSTEPAPPVFGDAPEPEHVEPIIVQPESTAPEVDPMGVGYVNGSPVLMRHSAVALLPQVASWAELPPAPDNT